MLKLADMTLTDLKILITEVVKEQLQIGQTTSSDQRSVEEVLAAMEQVRWTPPANAPTTGQLLREDRDC
ncbi:MAG: hypothetical protein AAF773_14385 [Cyanobacteria bacterium P01_D01_bin.115]